MKNSKSEIVGFLADSVVKFSTEIDIFIKNHQKWESKFDVKFFLMVFNGKILWVLLCAPPDNLSLK